MCGEKMLYNMLSLNVQTNGLNFQQSKDGITFRMRKIFENKLNFSWMMVLL